MTSPYTSPDPVAGRLEIRLVAAWALLGYTALHLLFAFLTWVVPDGGTFSGRSAGASFANLFTGALPLIAVALATWMTPQLAGAKRLAGVALIEYGVILFFGMVTLLVGLGPRFDGADGGSEALAAVRYLIMGTGGLLLLTVAAWATLRAYASMGGRLPSVTP